MPGDATAEERAQAIRSLGLDRPLWDQYLTFLNNALHGDLGTSLPLMVGMIAAAGLYRLRQGRFLKGSDRLTLNAVANPLF